MSQERSVDTMLSHLDIMLNKAEGDEEVAVHAVAKNQDISSLPRVCLTQEMLIEEAGNPFPVDEDCPAKELVQATDVESLNPVGLKETSTDIDVQALSEKICTDVNQQLQQLLPALIEQSLREHLKTLNNKELK